MPSLDCSFRSLRQQLELGERERLLVVLERSERGRGGHDELFQQALVPAIAVLVQQQEPTLGRGRCQRCSDPLMQFGKRLMDFL